MTRLTRAGVIASLLVGTLLAAGAAAPTPSRMEPPGTYRWPLAGEPRLTRGFEPGPQRWSPGHRGVDLAAGPGAVVYAAGPGVVHYAGPVVDREVVSVAHPGGLRTTYEPLLPLVAPGDPVVAGHPIGLLVLGHPNCDAEACLHWGLRRGSVYLDPLILLGLGRVRLLPVP